MRHPLTIEKCCYRFDLDIGFFSLNRSKNLVMPEPFLAFQAGRRIAIGYHEKAAMLSETIERELPYSPEQLFDIAADVERYPEFLRWWMAARVRDRQAKDYCTDQVLGLGPVRINFASETRLDRPRRIEVLSNDSAFRHFNICWRFEPRPDASCRVRLSVNLELRSRLLQTILEQGAPDTASDMMSAFEARARQLFEPPRR